MCRCFAHLYHLKPKKRHCEELDIIIMSYLMQLPLEVFIEHVAPHLHRLDKIILSSVNKYFHSIINEDAMSLVEYRMVCISFGYNSLLTGHPSIPFNRIHAMKAIRARNTEVALMIIKSSPLTRRAAFIHAVPNCMDVVVDELLTNYQDDIGLSSRLEQHVFVKSAYSKYPEDIYRTKVKLIMHKVFVKEAHYGEMVMWILGRT